jgi:DNA-binding NtrC family response regulator/CHASE2 domain-containing sensor protein
MRRFLGFFLGGISAGIILFMWYTNIVSLPQILKQTEIQTIDYRMKFSRQPAVSDAIKIVVVNDVSNLSDKLATFMKLFSTPAGEQYKPKVIGLNYLFDVPTVNEELLAAASASRNVYYGYYFLLTPQKTPAQDINQDILPFRLEITDIGEGISKVLEAHEVKLPSQKYLVAARGIGFVNAPADLDDVCRRIPLFLRYQGNWYGSLALLIAMEYLDIDSVDITFYPGQYLEIVRADGSFMKIPVNRYGQMLIDFAYDATVGGVAPFETLSMEDDILALADQMDQISASSPLARLKDAIVLVGSGSQSSPALQPIPLAKSYPLIGIHANVINNLLNNHFARELRFDFIVGLMTILSMITGLAISGRRFIVKLFLALLIAGIYLLISYGVFFQFRLLFPILPALLSVGLTVCSVGVFVRYKPKVSPVQPQQQLTQEKKRKTKVSSDALPTLEKELLEVREELDRKSFRLRSKVEELRVLQEQIDANHYAYSEYSGQVASLQKEIRAREIEIKSLVMREEEMRRQVENLPFTDTTVAQFKQNPEKLAQLFAKYGFIAHDDNLLSTLQRVEKLGKTSVALLIQGEPGTGKNLLATIIRELSPRHNRPILDVLCGGDMDLLEDDLFGHKKGAFPGADEHRNGYFRENDGGTLVLEDVDQLSLEIQTRLIQTLRGKVVRPIGDDRGCPVDVRVLATTSQNLKTLVSAGKFREDLYHYFSIFPLYLPPLRDRKEDIPLLVTHFVQKYNRVHSKIVATVSDSAMNLLIAHQWPGNVAELEKVIERAVAEINPGVKELSEKDMTFEEADLTGGIKDHGMLNYLISLMDTNKELPSYQQLREKVLVEIQRVYCARLLRLHNGNVKSAAIDTGLKEETFKKMLTELMIDPEHYRI